MEKYGKCDFCGRLNELLFNVRVPFKIWDRQFKSIAGGQYERYICFTCCDELWEAIGKIKYNNIRNNSTCC
ncbi:MAG: hypothetical protein KA369_03655 [Spirochaetes bacterium]|nr:hypothetical protein [Spirochaetota bacterium]